MPKVKLPRNSPSIDMTPMVDLAFLLVTFFMLTTKFRPEEPVKVVIPFSVSSTKIPENITTLSIDSAGRVFFDMDGKDVRPKVLQAVMEKYKLDKTLTQDDINRFAVMGTMGEPVNQVKQYIEGNDADRKVMSNASAGIPMDTLHNNNQLADWVYAAFTWSLDDYTNKHASNPTMKPPRFAIKADGRAKYKVVKQVIDICQKVGVQHFELITSLKSMPKPN
jgi:biopolymer transport protein ExbD